MLLPGSTKRDRMHVQARSVVSLFQEDHLGTLFSHVPRSAYTGRSTCSKVRQRGEQNVDCGANEPQLYYLLII